MFPQLFLEGYSESRRAKTACDHIDVIRGGFSVGRGAVGARNGGDAAARGAKGAGDAG